MLRYVTIAKFSELSGYTAKACQRKIEDCVWLEGEVWVRAPDGRVLIDVEGFQRWVTKGTAPASGRPRRAA